MSLAMTKLKMSHLFVNSRRMAKQVLKDEKKAAEIRQRVQNLLRDAEHFATYTPDEVTIATFQAFIHLTKEYYEDAVFVPEEDMLVILLGDIDDFSKFSAHLAHEVTKFEHGEVNDESAKSALEATQQVIHSIDQEVSVKLRKAFKQIRDQKRNREKRGDRVNGFKQLTAGVDIRHSLKELRAQEGKESHKEKELARLEAELESLLKKYHGAKTDSKGAILEKIERVASELLEHAKEEQSILAKILADTMFVIKYSVYQYFVYEEIIEIAEGLLKKLYSEGHLYRDSARKISDMFVHDLEDWMNEHAKSQFILMKRFGNHVGHELKKGDT